MCLRPSGWLERRLQLVLAEDSVVTARNSGWTTVLSPPWTQRHLSAGDYRCYAGHWKLLTAILFSKLVHYRVPQEMSISEMLLWFKNITPKAKYGTLYGRHIGSRTVGRSDLTEKKLVRKYRTATNFTLLHSKRQTVWICLCYKQIMQHVLYWWGWVKYRFYKKRKMLYLIY